VGECGSTCRCQPVGAAPILARHSLDETESFQPVERFVESSGRESNAGELLDVLGQRPAVLRTVGGTGENQGGRPGEAAEFLKLIGRRLRLHDDETLYRSPVYRQAE